MQPRFGPRRTQMEKLRAIKDWTRAALNLSPDTTVLVSELECREDGCPPLETIIAVLAGPRSRIERKVHVAVDDLTREMVVQLFSDEA